MDNIEIVLVHPQTAGNIGSVARALKNTGFKNLALINPVDYKCDEAFSFACNAIDVLKGAKVFSSLEAAINGSSLVIGTTRRKGKLRTPLLKFDEAIKKILSIAKKNKVSILFGREDKGLKNEEIELSDIVFEIPTHKAYPSLNLSHAVFAVCHALFTAHTPKTKSFIAAPKEDVELMYAHLEKALRGLGYEGKKGGQILKSIMRNFRRLYGRTSLMPKEVNMIRGILKEMEKNLKK